MAGIGSTAAGTLAQAQTLFPTSGLFADVGPAGSIGVAGPTTPLEVAPGSDHYQTAQYEINAYASATIADSLGTSQSSGASQLGGLSVPGESKSQMVSNQLQAQSALILSNTIDTTA